MRGAGLGLALLILACTACGGSSSGAGPCGLGLVAARGGELPFTIPERGTAERRQLRRAFLQCTLRRRDGSLFARLRSDERERVLAVAFYRRSGALRRATGAVYAATPKDTSAHGQVRIGEQEADRSRLLAADP